MGKTKDHKTGNGEYNGACAFVVPVPLMTGAASASREGASFIAPFDMKLEEALFSITDTVAASAYVRVRVGGTAVASLNLKDLSAGLVDILGAGAVTTTFEAAKRIVPKGSTVAVTLGNTASVAGLGTLVFNGP